MAMFFVFLFVVLILAGIGGWYLLKGLVRLVRWMFKKEISDAEGK